ncbi:cell wall-binding repeat-containing protein [Candidatus Poriferisodalis sp.]|uniref:cell wall-binding repeat-containing protein n=1 Tax=Candidatus Poriferisodalis sp. TaxID=3101277 RepID=UPI003B01B766
MAIPTPSGTRLGTGAVGAQAVTMIDLSVSPSSIGEGTQGPVTVTVTATFQASATRSTGTVVTLESPLEGTAVVDTDYTHTALPASLTIPAGASSASESFMITPVQDSLDEDAGETVKITGTSSSPSDIVNPAMLTIADDDTISNAMYTSASPSGISEADTATTVTLTASLGGSVAYAMDLTVTMHISDSSTATKGESGDYTLDPDPPRAVTIPAGQLSGTTTVTITPIQDTHKERTEWIRFWGAHPMRNSGSVGGRVELFDDDWRPPEAVDFLASTSTGAGSVRLSWSAPRTPADLPLTGYILQRRPSSGHVRSVDYDPWEEPGVTTVRLAPGATSYVAGGLACDTWYAWRLFASNADGESAASNDSNALTRACPTGGGSGGGGSGGGGSGGGGDGFGGGGSADEEEAGCRGSLSDTVILANGWSAADIGVAAALAARTADSAVLYTSADRLEPAAEEALCKLSPRRVVAVGGTAALAPAVLTAAHGVVAGVEVDRIAGADRVDTAAQAAREVLGSPGAGAGRVVVIANGWSAPDIGAAAALAARMQNAAVLLSSAEELPAPARRVIVDYPVVRVVVVGGEGAVSAGVFDAVVAAAGEAAVERLTGSDRAATAAAAARRSLGDPGQAARRTVVIVDGWRPPDVGIATALVARTADAAVVYAAPGALPEPTRQLLVDYRPARVVIIGGAGAVPASVSDAVEAAAPATRLTRIDGADRIDTAAEAAQWSPGAS